MNKKLKLFLNSLRQISLQPEEKLLLRERLRLEMGLTATPIELTPPTRIPWPYFYWRLVPASLAIILFVSGALSAAAERALPGQLLYSIKLEINEPLGRLLTGSTPEQVFVHETDLLEKRLKEAEKLYTSDKLNDQELKAEVKFNLVKQQDKVNEIRRRVRPESADLVMMPKKDQAQTSLEAPPKAIQASGPEDGGGPEKAAEAKVNAGLDLPADNNLAKVATTTTVGDRQSVSVKGQILEPEERDGDDQEKEVPSSNVDELGRVLDKYQDIINELELEVVPPPSQKF